jgi:hypothetical protein
MHNSLLYRQTRRNNCKELFIERDFLCVCMPETSVWTKVKEFNGYSDAAPAGSKSAALRWFSPPIRAIKYLLSQNWFTTPNIMFVRSSRNLISTALKHWIRNLGRAARQNLQKMTKLLSPRQPNARRTFWAALSNAGRWKNCVSIWWPKGSFPLSVSRLFARFCTKKKSDSGEQRPGKNATIRSSNLKKTDSQVCKPSRLQRPDNILRRIRSFGDSSCSGAGLVSQQPPQKVACDIYPASRCSSLDVVLRCTSEKTMGIRSSTQKTSGSARCVEAASRTVSHASADTFDSGQFLAAPQAEGVGVLPSEQYSHDLDTDQCIMAESYRMSVHTCERICDSWNQLSKS